MWCVSLLSVFLLVVSPAFLQGKPAFATDDRVRRSNVCYGYTHRDSSYDVILDDEISEFSCCFMSDAMHVARWRVISGGKTFQPPICRNSEAPYFACWKYFSRLLVKLYVNATEVRNRGGSAVCICGSEPLWNDDFSVTTNIRVKTEEEPTTNQPTVGPTTNEPEGSSFSWISNTDDACRVLLRRYSNNSVDEEEEKDSTRVRCRGDSPNLSWEVRDRESTSSSRVPDCNDEDVDVCQTKGKKGVTLFFGPSTSLRKFKCKDDKSKKCHFASRPSKAKN